MLFTLFIPGQVTRWVQELFLVFFCEYYFLDFNKNKWVNLQRLFWVIVNDPRSKTSQLKLTKKNPSAESPLDKQVFDRWTYPKIFARYVTDEKD